MRFSFFLRRWGLGATVFGLLAACSDDSPVLPSAPVVASDAGISTDGGYAPDAGPSGPDDLTIATTPWRELTAGPRISGKQDDVFFFDRELGFSVNGLGNIYRTMDAGETWENIVQQPGTFYRAILFTSPTRGFVANIGPGVFPGVTDQTPLYETFDGGLNWSPVTNITGPVPAGICNLQRATDGTLVAVGRVAGPSFVMISTNDGASWTSSEVTSQIAMLIDTRFVSANEGIIIGGSDRNTTLSRTIVLRTEDGGASWQEIYRSSRTSELGWKLSFPSESVGYASVLAYHGESLFLKTTDGGRTWQERPMNVGPYEAKGIGFINERVGWIGGERPGAPSYVTVDGGDSWQPATGLGSLINRFRFVDDRTGYAIGSAIYKLEVPR